MHWRLFPMRSLVAPALGDPADRSSAPPFRGKLGQTVGTLQRFSLCSPEGTILLVAVADVYVILHSAGRKRMRSTQRPLELLQSLPSEHFPSLGHFDELLLVFRFMRAGSHLSADPSMFFVFCNFTHGDRVLDARKPRAESGAGSDNANGRRRVIVGAWGLARRRPSKSIT